MLSFVTETVSHGVDALGNRASALLREKTLRLGVTGLSRSGKTVFITSLVANLLDRGRMPQLRATTNATIQTVYLQPQPDDTLPRFDFEKQLAAILGEKPRWPDSTRAMSELRLSFRLQSRGMIRTFGGHRVVHIDILDYPGEWLLDIALLNLSYEEWSREILSALLDRPEASAYFAFANTVDPDARLEELTMQKLSQLFTTCLQDLRTAEQHIPYTPGRFLLPGELLGTPALTFAPLRASRRGLGREFQRRYEAYKTRVVRPFLRDYIAPIDRQVVLVDTLGALAKGPQATTALREQMGAILGAFRPGRRIIPGARWFLGPRVERILFAASKADRVHHSHHGALSAMTESLLREARDRAQFSGSDTAAMAIAGLRTTTEDTIVQDGKTIEAVRGWLPHRERPVLHYPGNLPTDPGQILRSMKDNADKWPFGEIQELPFLPAPAKLISGEGPPHIRLDKAAEFLIGDQIG